MRRSDTVILTAALALSGCETTLPGGDLGEPAANDQPSSPAVASACLPFASLSGIEAAGGAIHTLARPDGSIRIILDGAQLAGASVSSLDLQLMSVTAAGDCLSGASLATGTPRSALDGGLTIRSLVPTAAGSVAYVADGSGTVGVATESTDGRYLAADSKLWTSDRPGFGDAAVAVGDEVDTMGCRPTRFLDADCFAARAPLANAADESAYSYYLGGGRWSPRVDDAWPMTTGAGSFDVMPYGERFLLASVSPLGTTIAMRTGITPHGPWSAPIDVASCDLPDADMFCASVRLHPALSTEAGTIVVTYAPASLSSDAPARREQNPRDFWPRLVTLPVPALP